VRPIAKRLILGTTTCTEVILRIIFEVHFYRFVVRNYGIGHMFSRWVLIVMLMGCQINHGHVATMQAVPTGRTFRRLSLLIEDKSWLLKVYHYVKHTRSTYLKMQMNCQFLNVCSVQGVRKCPGCEKTHGQKSQVVITVLPDTGGRYNLLPMSSEWTIFKWWAVKDYSGHPALHPYGPSPLRCDVQIRSRRICRTFDHRIKSTRVLQFPVLKRPY